jgi:hypothetical protein
MATSWSSSRFVVISPPFANQMKPFALFQFSG